MKTFTVDTLDQWKEISDRLIIAGYKLCITQYSIDDPEGLHVTFWAPDKPMVEFVTHNDAVGEAMSKMPVE